MSKNGDHADLGYDHGLPILTSLVFESSNSDVMKSFNTGTTCVVVGKYFVMRPKNAKHLNYVPIFDQETLAEDGQKTLKLYTLSLSKWIKDSAVSRFSFKELSRSSMYYQGGHGQYESLLQVCIGSDLTILSLDNPGFPLEVARMESVSQLISPEKLFDTGFDLEYFDKDQRISESLSLGRNFQVFRRGNIVDNYITLGYSYSDLRALKSLYEAVKEEDKLPPKMPTDLLLCKFPGHTTVSLLSQFPKGMMTIHKSLVEQDFEPETTELGFQIQNSFMRKFHRILTLPVMDTKDEKPAPKQPQIQAQAQAQAEGEEEAQVAKYVGKHSILRKSLYMKDSSLRDKLFRIAMLCDDTNIADFVFRLEDLTMLFRNLSPQMMDFLQEKTFIDNIQSKSIDSVKWGSDNEFHIENQTVSFIHLNDIESRMREGCSEEELVIKEIDTKIMPVSWVFSSHTGRQTNFKDFIQSLKNLENETIFGLEITKYLVESVWPNYQWQVILKVFFPFLIHLILTHLFFMLICNEDSDKPAFGWGRPEFYMRNVIILLCCVFLYLEGKQLKYDGWEYFKDPFNYS